MNKVLFSSSYQDWQTPSDLFESLDSEFHFTLDPCASHYSAKCNRYYTKEQNGLGFDWSNRRVFCNPPYNEVDLWVSKCYFESRYNNALCVMLIPARTDTKWFHKYIYPYAEIRFIKGRLKFLDRFGNSLNSAPFPSLVAVFRPN